MHSFILFMVMTTIFPFLFVYLSMALTVTVGHQVTAKHYLFVSLLYKTYLDTTKTMIWHYNNSVSKDFLKLCHYTFLPTYIFQEHKSYFCDCIKHLYRGLCLDVEQISDNLGMIVFAFELCIVVLVSVTL